MTNYIFFIWVMYYRAHNKETRQTFYTKEDLLRYVHYAENILPLNKFEHCIILHPLII